MLILYHCQKFNDHIYKDYELIFMEVESWEEFYKKLLSDLSKYNLVDIGKDLNNWKELEIAIEEHNKKVEDDDFFHIIKIENYYKKSLFLYHKQYICDFPYTHDELNFIEAETKKEFYKKLLSDPFKYKLVCNDEDVKETQVMCFYYDGFFGFKENYIPMVSEEEFIEKYVDTSKWEKLEIAIKKENIKMLCEKFYHVVKVVIK